MNRLALPILVLLLATSAYASDISESASGFDFADSFGQAQPTIPAIDPWPGMPMPPIQMPPPDPWQPAPDPWVNMPPLDEPLPMAPVPEPATVVMWGTGILGLAALTWRKRRQARKEQR